MWTLFKLQEKVNDERPALCDVAITSTGSNECHLSLSSNMCNRDEEQGSARSEDREAMELEELMRSLCFKDGSGALTCQDRDKRSAASGACGIRERRGLARFLFWVCAAVRGRQSTQARDSKARTDTALRTPLASLSFPLRSRLPPNLLPNQS
jgi:hypothetical protein